MIFEAGIVYTVNPEGSILPRCTQIALNPGETVGKIPDPQAELIVSGILRDDFALFATVIDNDGADEIGYLITQYRNQDHATIVPSQLILEHPGSYITREFAALVDRIPYGEIEQFSLAAIKKYVGNHFSH